VAPIKGLERPLDVPHALLEVTRLYAERLWERVLIETSPTLAGKPGLLARSATTRRTFINAAHNLIGGKKAARLISPPDMI